MVLPCIRQTELAAADLPGQGGRYRGAGDGFAVGLISAHLEGLPVEAGLVRAAAIGALATTSSGEKDGLPDRNALAAFLAGAKPQTTEGSRQCNYR